MNLRNLGYGSARPPSPQDATVAAMTGTQAGRADLQTVIALFISIRLLLLAPW